MHQKHRLVQPHLLLNNKIWQTGPSYGFLTPTSFLSDEANTYQFVYGGVRDNTGRSVIRYFSLSADMQITAFENICFDRRGSGSFDTDGTILGHVNSVKDTIRLYYVGFRRSKKVKFQAFSGLAESVDGGNTFYFKRRIFDESNFSFLDGYEPDIIACHWNNLNLDGDGLALVAIGNGWIKIGTTSYPKYSSYLVNVQAFQFASLIAKFPQKLDLYRLGRPRLLSNQTKIAVATGGRVDGDYRPYFFEIIENSILERPDIVFEVEPGSHQYCNKQVSYPELINFSSVNRNIFLFNADDMGGNGCYGFITKAF